jgi:hypothetical protein
LKISKRDPPKSFAGPAKFFKAVLAKILGKIAKFWEKTEKL